MPFTFSIKLNQSLLARLRSSGQRSERSFRRYILRVADSARRNAGGGVLHRRTGRLASSVSSQVERQGTELWGRVGTNVVYGPIHEFGGVIPAHIVRPVRANVLRFNVGGETVFARFARIPPVVIPERPWIRPAFEQHRAQLMQELGLDYQLT